MHAVQSVYSYLARCRLLDRVTMLQLEQYLIRENKTWLMLEHGEKNLYCRISPSLFRNSSCRRRTALCTVIYYVVISEQVHDKFRILEFKSGWSGYVDIYSILSTATVDQTKSRHLSYQRQTTRSQPQQAGLPSFTSVPTQPTSPVF